MPLLSACAPKMSTKLAEFPLMYEERPASILILPPMNESTAADAKEYYSTTIQEPLAFTGYYTFSYPITSEILKMEGIYDTELLVNLPLSKFKEYFGADAVFSCFIDRACSVSEYGKPAGTGAFLLFSRFILYIYG